MSVSSSGSAGTVGSRKNQDMISGIKGRSMGSPARISRISGIKRISTTSRALESIGLIRSSGSVGSDKEKTRAGLLG